MVQKIRRMSRLARSIVFLSCSYVAACGDPVATTPDPPHITGVSLSPMVEGQTATLTGTNFSANTVSNTVTIDNVTLAVTAASETSLTVTIPEGCGPLRIASLQVTIGGMAGNAFNAAVAPDPGADVQEASLAVGEQVVYRQPRHCFGLPTNGGTAQYLVGVQSTGRNGSVTRQVVVGGSAVGTALAGPATHVAAALTAPNVPPRRSPPWGNLGSSPVSRLIQDHRKGHNALMADLVRPVRSPAVRSGALSPQRAPARVVVDGTENVGDQLDLRVRGLSGDCSAENTTTVTAELRVKTPGSMWWVDVSNPANGLTDTDLQDMGTLFDDFILAAEVAEFGAVGDLDGNGRVAILLTQEVNADTTAGGQTLGFVNPCDLVLRDEPAGLFASNEGEFFYAIAPDPTGAVGVTLTATDLLDILPIIVAHEFAHIIQFSRRIASPTALDLMAPFMMEGQATLAEEIVGHAVNGNTPGQNFDEAVAYNTGSTQGHTLYAAPFSDLVFYYGWPGSQDTPRVDGTPHECTWIEAQVEHPCGGRPLWYGVTWSFLRWASDLYGPALGGEAAFQTALIDGDLSDFDNLEQALAGQGTLEDHLARWAAMLYMDGRPGASPENSMSSWDMLSFALGFADTAWLHPVEHPFADFSETVTLRDPSTAYFLVGGSGASSHTLRVTGPSGGDLGSDVQVWLVRTQ